jgi:hypothetical protein
MTWKFQPTVLYGCKRRQIKERLMIPWAVERVNALQTNLIMPKHSLETLATISKLKYCEHITHSSDCMGKNFIILLPLLLLLLLLLHLLNRFSSHWYLHVSHHLKNLLLPTYWNVPMYSIKINIM